MVHKNSHKGKRRHSKKMRGGADMGWCMPTVIYLTLSAIGVIGSTLFGRYSMAPGVMLSEIIHIAFWTAILYFLCATGYTGVSWFILLIPFILWGIFIVFGANFLQMIDLKQTVNASEEGTVATQQGAYF
jgi:hypothetical protein